MVDTAARVKFELVSAYRAYLWAETERWAPKHFGDEQYFRTLARSARRDAALLALTLTSDYQTSFRIRHAHYLTTTSQ
jgi:hypothetical protein